MAKADGYTVLKSERDGHMIIRPGTDSMRVPGFYVRGWTAGSMRDAKSFMAELAAEDAAQ